MMEMPLTEMEKIGGGQMFCLFHSGVSLGGSCFPCTSAPLLPAEGSLHQLTDSAIMSKKDGPGTLAMNGKATA